MPLDNFDMSFYKDMIARDSNQRVDVDFSIKGTAAIPEPEPKKEKASDKLKDISEDTDIIIDAEVIDKEVSKIDKVKSKGKDIVKTIAEKSGDSSILEDQETEKEMNQTFNSIIQDINKQYNLDFNYSYGSFSKNLAMIMDPRQKKVAELVLSKTFSSVRLNIYMQLMGAVEALSSQILDPKYILSESIAYGDKLLIMKQIFEFMQSLNTIYSEINIEDTEMKLAKIGEDDDNLSGININSPEIKEFLHS